jgi:hypothetical protein
MSAEDVAHLGGCLCGHIRYAAGPGAFHETLCHCSICRRSTGAPLVAWFSVPRAAFRFVTGQPTSFQSTSHGTRSFCPHCGTQLTFEDADHPDEIDITSCSLDEPNALPPKDHTHTATQLRWLTLGDDLPKHERARSR